MPAQRVSSSSRAAPTSLPLPLPFQQAALSWFAAHRRRLPWRVSQSPEKGARGEKIRDRPDPYGVWVSEIMAQQTQIATMVPYWLRWMERFPTVQSLAAASEEDVRGAWAGLGYYRRAVNLRRGALHVLENHGGAVPTTSKALCEVPGIGPYTAGAIASICFSEEVPAVDGNVIRVLARVAAEPGVDPKTPASGKWARECAQRLIAGCPDPGSFNEALMEIGATVCRPSGAPSCGTCPLAVHCSAKRLLDANLIDAIEGIFPEKSKPTAKSTARIACVIHCAADDTKKKVGEQHHHVLLVQRPAAGVLLAGMYDFPSVITTGTGDASSPSKQQQAAMREQLPLPSWAENTPPTVKSRRKPTAQNEDLRPTHAPRYAGTVRHVFSHIDMYLSCFVVEWASVEQLKRAAQRMGGMGLLKAATPQAVKKIEEDADGSAEEEEEEEQRGRKRRRREQPAEGPSFRVVPVSTVSDEVPVSRLVHKAITCAGLN
jgi:A/G-specific adenine glycosylase